MEMPKKLFLKDGPLGIRLSLFEIVITSFGSRCVQPHVMSQKRREWKTSGGEGGIRTHGPGVAPQGLAGVARLKVGSLKPLGHLSTNGGPDRS